jgi:exopolyphosphatase/guanosine-5'-triphosphate,3'-diphosphate pyrophosphatase
MNRFAVIDIGSNSVRLMTIANGKVLYKTIKTTRLGEGLAFSSKLKDEAIDRTVLAIKAFAERAISEGAQNIYAYATAAVRSAQNGSEFVGKVKEECGVAVEIISGTEEAQIGLLGAIGKKDGAIIDIGGASTELIEQKNGKIVYEKSLNIGVVRIKDICGRDREKTRELALKTVKEYGLNSIAGRVYAIGGTATTLGALALGMERYDGNVVTGARLKKMDVLALADKLFSMSVEEIKKLPCVDELRADVLAGGVEWLYVIMEYLKIPEIIISDGDNLEGYAISRNLLCGE